MEKKTAEIDEAQARELLTRERKRIESALADLKRVQESQIAEVDTATAAEDDAEVIEEETVDRALEEQLRSELEAIERAEQRLEDGTYGISIQSGEPIPAGRLEAVPWAERTAEEQARVEGGGG